VRNERVPAGAPPPDATCLTISEVARVL
jgi:hypothetical protein